MQRLVFFILLVALIGGGVYVYVNFDFAVKRDQDGKFQYLMMTPKGTVSPADLPGGGPGGLPPATARSVIRIATFNVTRLDEKKLDNHRVADVLVHLLPRFEIVALQDIRARNQGVLVRLVDQINKATGQNYRFAVGRDFARDPAAQYGAFLFDSASIEIDHALANAVEDPTGGFRNRPLVASFRVRGPSKEEAFTFKLVNVHVDRTRASAELDLLDDVYRTLRDGGSQEGGSREDDVIVLGDFGADDQNLGQLGQVLDITSAIVATPTTLRAAGPVDNILFDRQASCEFTGRAEVLDLMREFDLTMRQTLEVSDHLPVWAEFNALEGGRLGHMAAETGRTTR